MPPYSQRYRMWEEMDAELEKEAFRRHLLSVCSRPADLADADDAAAFAAEAAVGAGAAAEVQAEREASLQRCYAAEERARVEQQPGRCWMPL